MPTNANVFNSRVTSEALEAKFRQVFPSQGGAELVQDLYASGVIQPVIDFSTVAEGSVLASNLQTAWDFSTGAAQINNTTTNLITNTGFWLVDVTWTGDITQSTATNLARVEIFDGSTAKPVWAISNHVLPSSTTYSGVDSNQFVVFLRSGDTLRGISTVNSSTLDVWYRQIADVNGNLVNPLGFTFS